MLIFESSSFGRDSGKSTMMSGFLFSILSPVWKAKICSVFRFANNRLDLTYEDAASFLIVVKLGCGHNMKVQGGLSGLLDVGRLADMYRIEQPVDWEAEQWLTVNTCGELLARSCNAGMPRLEKCCRELALERFEAVAWRGLRASCGWTRKSWARCSTTTG